MSAQAHKAPLIQVGLMQRTKVLPSEMTSATFEKEVVQAPPMGFAVAVTRFMVRRVDDGTDPFSSVGANDNLILRHTSKDGGYLSPQITGDGFLNKNNTDDGFGTRMAGPGRGTATITGTALASGQAVVLAYTDSADGVTDTGSDGYFEVTVEYDLVYVGNDFIV